MKLIANALTCERNGRVVFSGLGFSVAAGELVELRGPNGSGKSSLLRLIAGLVPAAAGTLALLPADDSPLPRHCHYIGHLDALKNAMTVRENLAFWSLMLGGSGDLAALDAFKLTHLADDPVQLLSAGQRRRLSLARLLAAPRRIWLLDEPATALDVASQATLAGLIDDHLKGGGIVLAAIHGEGLCKPNHLIHLGQPT
jgi:heme exporter protein A